MWSSRPRRFSPGRLVVDDLREVAGGNARTDPYRTRHGYERVGSCASSSAVAVVWTPSGLGSRIQGWTERAQGLNRRFRLHRGPQTWRFRLPVCRRVPRPRSTHGSPPTGTPIVVRRAPSPSAPSRTSGRSDPVGVLFFDDQQVGLAVHAGRRSPDVGDEPRGLATGPRLQRTGEHAFRPVQLVEAVGIGWNISPDSVREGHSFGHECHTGQGSSTVQRLAKECYERVTLQQPRSAGP
jgi:hypothetical protein